MIGERDYGFNDEQVAELGFTSYEELEPYYDLFFGLMDHRPWPKQECIAKLNSNVEFQQRWNLPREKKIEASLIDEIRFIVSAAKVNSHEEFEEIQDNLNRHINVYYHIAKKLK